MRIQLILTFILISFNVLATDDKSMQDLFSKYDLVMDHKKIELIDEVFTQKFIKEAGGKEELIEKIKELSPSKEKNAQKTKMSWKKGLKSEIYFAKVKNLSPNKSKKESEESEFIIMKEDGKLKIDGTISDGN
jgi:hypothetical protein